jgi:hypothetical protein
MIVKTVYSYYYPETRDIVGRLWRDEPHTLYDKAWEKETETSHFPFLAAWKDWSGVDVAGFPHGYPTNGASEAIKDLISLMPSGARLHIFAGEYEGYARIAECHGIEVVIHDPDLEKLVQSCRFMPGDLFFVSNPSAIDGEYRKDFDAFALTMRAYYPSVGIVLDVSYVGTVQRHRLLWASRHPNIRAVVFSLSKPFGVYNHRIGGCFSRQEVGTLYGNRWFKNHFSIELGRQLMEKYAVDALPKKYAAAQQAVIEKGVEAGVLPAETIPCNVVLLARSAAGPAEFLRAPGHYRYCLTPGFDAWSKEKLR